MIMTSACERKQSSYATEFISTDHAVTSFISAAPYYGFFLTNKNNKKLGCFDLTSQFEELQMQAIRFLVCILLLFILTISTSIYSLLPSFPRCSRGWLCDDNCLCFLNISSIFYVDCTEIQAKIKIYQTSELGFIRKISHKIYKMLFCISVVPFRWAVYVSIFILRADIVIKIVLIRELSLMVNDG